MLTIIDEENIKYGRAPTKPYGYYFMAISEHIPWLKEQISKSKDGYIYVRKNDIEDVLGIRVKTFDALLWALKFVLFEHGMIVNKAHLKDETRVFSIRIGTEDDVLPASLRRLLTYEIFWI